jgi:hypothetical protein
MGNEGFVPSTCAVADTVSAILKIIKSNFIKLDLILKSGCGEPADSDSLNISSM